MQNQFLNVGSSTSLQPVMQLLNLMIRKYIFAYSAQFMEDIRKLLTTYAYNILGSYEDAKDVVQDAYLKFYNTADSDSIENKKAYLVRTVINLSINLKKRKNASLTQYPGAYLPEPLETEKPDSNIVRRDILSYSLMVLLDKLNPKQRAVFILREAFDYDHKEIAEVLQISEESSRKMLSRAKQQLQHPSIIKNAAQSKEYVEKYLGVIYNADIDQLEHLLHDEVSIISDGGGKASALLRPLYGKASVAKFLMGIYQKFYSTSDVQIQKTNINHQPGLLLYKKQELSVCQVFEFENGKIRRIYFVRNPDKLQSL